MGDRMEHEMEQLLQYRLRLSGLMESQRENHMDNEMDSGNMRGFG